MIKRMMVSGRVVTPERVVDGYVRVDGDRIAEIGAGGVETDHWLVPGFVDIHCHGGGGHSFTTGDAGAARAAAAFHRRHGTTTQLASLVSAPFPLMRAATEAFAPLVGEGVIAGIHFEGPYLSPARCGAQNPDYLRDPSTAELSELIALGHLGGGRWAGETLGHLGGGRRAGETPGAGAVRMVTLAAERDGALDAIRLLTDRGVVAAIGHTDATYHQTQAAVAAGATVATHLCNAMRPVHHREPGPIVALLDATTVVCELIADGVHLHDGMLGFAAGAAGAERTALVTDAIDAAGMPDGAYDLGGQSVVVSDRVARLATADGSPGAIAGSTLTMDAALRRAVGAGVPLVDAARMAATTPARVLGLAGELGALVPGLRADLVELDRDLRVMRVMRAGSWVDGAQPE